jgi:hypothetical protein
MLFVEERRAPLRAQMAFDGELPAREYYIRLREFNTRHGYPEDNNLPLPENVPENVSISEYLYRINPPDNREIQEFLASLNA